MMKLKAGKISIGLEFPFFALAAYFLSGDMRKNFMLAVLFSLLHETGHVVSIALSGGRIREISTDFSGIRINKCNSGMSYKAECITALAGPFVNLIFVVLFSFMKNINATRRELLGHASIARPHLPWCSRPTSQCTVLRDGAFL